MKLISYLKDDSESCGLWVEAGVIDLPRRMGSRARDLRSLLESDLLGEVAQYRDETPDFLFQDLRLAPVIPNPRNVLCVGLNYEDHRAETRRPQVDHPTIFMRVQESLAAHGSPLWIPTESDQFDYEGELAIVIGRQGRRIPEAAAWDHVAGVSCFNEGTVRDWQYHTHQFGPGKNFPGTGAFGPAFVTLDELPDDRALKLETRVNGEVVQSVLTSQMIFPVPRLIAYCSTFMTLYPGDVIVTGTPGGVGAKRQPPKWLAPGDTVEVDIEHVGTLRNVCQKEAA
jgi:2-keto-4-pentenoate hydratase/2-oxohepta-3-ene-1,7-dioic acid hydratase in catechol pathway